MIRVMIADDQVQVRSALQLFLKQDAEIVVVGEASDVDETLELAVEQQPDLVIVDWELPGGGGTAALDGLRRVAPQAKALVLSGRPEACRTALQAGADGFVSKGDPPERLLGAIRACFDQNIR